MTDEKLRKKIQDLEEKNHNLTQSLLYIGEFQSDREKEMETQILKMRRCRNCHWYIEDNIGNEGCLHEISCNIEWKPKYRILYNYWQLKEDES